MARDSRYCTKFRRRREGKTDYHARKAFVLSGMPRLVTRKSISNIIAQIIVAKPKGDEVLVSAHSRELVKYGWKAPRGNLSAAYLTGFLCGLKAKAQGVEGAILDIGLYPPTKGARVFAVLKGVLDAKINVPHSESKLPDERRVRGEHISKYAESLASDVEEYQSTWSGYLKQEIKPETLPKHFEQVRKQMVDAFLSRGRKN
jgi:large subunit ribosomal protein L18